MIDNESYSDGARDRVIPDDPPQSPWRRFRPYRYWSPRRPAG
jgi:hypothetical protein